MSALTEHLVELLEKRRLHVGQMWAQVKGNPLFAKPGYALSDPYPAGITEEELAAFTSRTGIKLPEDVKQWLRITNGASGFYGIGSAQQGANMERLWELRPVLRQRWIPVGSDDFGNFYVRVVPESGGRGGVFYVEATSTDELEYAAASDTVHFALFSLEQRLEGHETYGWPRDKSFVLSKDPDLAHVEGARFFWDP